MLRGKQELPCCTEFDSSLEQEYVNMVQQPSGLCDAGCLLRNCMQIIYAICMQFLRSGAAF